MEAVYGGNLDEYSSHSIMKGKRTKRRRNFNRSAMSLSATTTTVSSTSSASDISGSRSTTTITEKEEEEEEMANCLILLAQGRGLIVDSVGDIGPPYAYKCTTCDRSFPSFQALGGHRTSHKKPKTSTSTVVTPAVMMIKGKKTTSQEDLKISGSPSPSPSVAAASPIIGAAKLKVHQCSICGSDFSSGQALGGHMRRHRSMAPSFSSQEVKKEKKLLFGLDLNLPAPPDVETTESSSSTGYHCISVCQPASTHLPILGELSLLSKLRS